MAAQKKRWFQIIAPPIFKERVVGETPAYDPKTIEGKTVTVSLFTLTDNMKKQSTQITLLVDAIKGDKAVTSVIGMRLIPNAIKRMIRKGRTRNDQVIRGITKDEKIVTLKMLLVTRNRVQGSVSTAIQNQSKVFLLEKIASMNYTELSDAIIMGALQKELKGKMAKLYPIRTCEVRHFKLEREMKAVDVRKIQKELEKSKKRAELMKEEAPEPVEEVAAEEPQTAEA